MDYFTKELIAALDKIRTEIVNLLHAIHDHKNAISKHGDACKSTSNEPLSVIATLSAPVAIREDQSTSKAQKIWKAIKTPLEIAGIIAVIIYTTLTYFMWRETHETNKAAQRSAATAQTQLELSERPWIKIVDVQPRGNFPIVGGLGFIKALPNSQGIEANATVQFNLSFTNIGHSVADVSQAEEFFMPQFSSSEYWNRVAAEEQRFCSSPDMKSVTSQKVVVFPGELRPFDLNIGITTPIRPENINHLPEGTGIFPALMVCVNYRQKGLPNVYQTRAVYEIFRADTHSRLFGYGKCNLQPFKNAPPTFMFCDGGVPAKLLKFDRNMNGDDAY